MSSLHTNVPTKHLAKSFYPLLAIGIILSSEIATIFSIEFVYRAMPAFWQNWSLFLIVAPLAALLVGLPAWWLYVIQAEDVTIQRGMITGCLCSIAAHPVMWMLIIGSDFLWRIFTHQLDSNQHSSFGMLLFFAVFGLFYVGWITTIIGTITGALLICLQRALTSERE